MAKSFLSLLANTKTRTLILIGGGIVLTGAIVAISSLGEDEDKAVKSSKTANVPVGIKSTPGEKTSERYRELQQEANLKGAEEAEKTGSTFIPTIVGDSDKKKNETDIQNEFLQALEGVQAGNKDAINNLINHNPAEQLGQFGIQDPQITALLAQQKQDEAAEAELRRQRFLASQSEQEMAMTEQRLRTIEKVSLAMEQQAQAALGTWTNIPTQQYTEGSWETEKKNKPSNLQTNAGTESKPVILKAGNITFAVLETAVNSDEPGPVMAKIVQGKLKGAKLIGSINVPSGGKKLALTFDTINIPSEPNSIGISAVAIDPDNARTHLASDVDNHYVLRWGSLFASAFLEGYSKAVGESGTSVQSTSAPGNTTTTTNKQSLSGRQQLFEGLGAVGERWSDKLSDNFTRSPTITIDSGIGVGILLTSDLKLGEEPETKTILRNEGNFSNKNSDSENMNTAANSNNASQANVSQQAATNAAENKEK